MSITVTMNGADYTIPSPGEANWGNNLNAYLMAIPAAINTASFSKSIQTFGANVSADTTPAGNPAGLWPGSSNAAALDPGSVPWNVPYQCFLEKMYVNICDGSFTGGVDSVTLKVVNIDTPGEIVVTIDSPLINGSNLVDQLECFPSDRIYASATMSTGALTFPGLVMVTIQVREIPT